jgi:hypothetical protein
LVVRCGRVPDRRWNRADFEIVIRSHDVAEGDLARRLPKRRKSEIRRLREILHEYHLSGRYLVPDESMSAHLAAAKDQLVCAVCGAHY